MLIFYGHKNGLLDHYTMIMYGYYAEFQEKGGLRCFKSSLDLGGEYSNIKKKSDYIL